MDERRRVGWRVVLVIGVIGGLIGQSTPVAWAQLREVDPALSAAVEALVAKDPEVAGDPELAQLCRHVAEATVLDPRERAAVTNEVAIIQRERIDVRTIIPQEVREAAREQFTKVQGEMREQLEKLRAADPEKAREMEFRMKEGERQMLAFETGERYTPSPEMISHAEGMFKEWETGMAAQGAPPEFVERARFEFARWSGGEMTGFGGPGHREFGGPGPGAFGPGGGGYDTGAAKELAAKLGIDPTVNLNDPAVIDRLVREGKLSQETLAKAMGELGTEGRMDGRLGEMARTYFGGPDAGSMGGRGYSQIDRSTASLVEALTKGGAISESRARELMAGGGNIFDPKSSSWDSLSKEEKAFAATVSQRAAEALAYEQAGGDKSQWRSGGEMMGGTASRGWEGGPNYGINPATGGWEPGMGGNSMGGGGPMGGGPAYMGGPTWEGGPTYSMAPWESNMGGGPVYGGGPTWEAISNYGINPATGGWEPNMGGTAYTGGTTLEGSGSNVPASDPRTWDQATRDAYYASTTSTAELTQDRQATQTTVAQERYESAIHLHENSTEHTHSIHVHTDRTRHDHTATSAADTATGAVFIP